jgi:hypothetical protein
LDSKIENISGPGWCPTGKKALKKMQISRARGGKGKLAKTLAKCGRGRPGLQFLLNLERPATSEEELEFSGPDQFCFVCWPVQSAVKHPLLLAAPRLFK